MAAPRRSRRDSAELRRDFERWDSFEFPSADGEITHRVFHRGGGPAVLLLHEMGGLNANCIELADEIVGAGFAVYLPLLFGEAFDDQANRNYFSPPPCIRIEIERFAAHAPSPLTGWLRELCSRRIAAEVGGPIGVIGMCLTGGYAIALVAEPNVYAPVTCHPAMPMPPLKVIPFGRYKSQLGIPPELLEKARRRVEDEGLRILGLRYEKDWICPRQRFERLREEFGEAFHEPVPLPFKGHSILTGDEIWADPQGEEGDPAKTAAANRALDATLAFLRQELEKRGDRPPPPRRDG